MGGVNPGYPPAQQGYTYQPHPGNPQWGAVQPPPYSLPTDTAPAQPPSSGNLYTDSGGVVPPPPSAPPPAYSEINSLDYDKR